MFRLSSGICALGVLCASVTAASVASLPPGPGLLGYWTMDGTFADASGNGHDGTAMNGVGFGPGRYGQAASFDGSDDYIRIAGPGDFAFQQESVSISAWIQVAANGPEYQNVFAIGDASPGVVTNYPSLHLAKSRSGFWDGRLYTEVYRNSGAPEYVLSDLTGPEIPPAGWTHVAAVVNYDGSAHDLTLYVNGVSQGTQSLTDFDLTGPSALGVLIGAHPDGTSGTGGNGHFGGLIDDVAIWNRTLSDDEVARLASLAPVPEPMTVLGVAAGVAGLYSYLRRRTG